MAPKKLLQDPPPATSSTEEEESSEEEEDHDAVENEERKRAVEEDEEKSEDEDDEDDDDEDEDEEEKSKSSVKKPTGAASTTARPDSDSDSGSESDSGSDQTQPSPTASAFTIKPISSRPMYDSPTPKKPGPKATTVSASAMSTSKRPAESSPNAKDSKKKKVVNGDDEETKKGTGNQRLWSEDDEIEILRGMTEYQSKKGLDPYADMGAFHEFIKKSLHVDVSKNQLMDKLRRLKKKYQVNAEKGGNGEDPVFSKQHEHQSFELSKKIWGPEANGKSKANARKSGKAANNKNNTPVTVALPKQDEGVKEVVMMDSEVKKDMVNGGVKKKADPDDFWTKYPHLSRSFTSVPEFGGSFMRERMSVIGNEKANDLDEKWRKIQMKEFELYLRRIELVEEQGKLFLDALKKSMD